MHAIDAGAGSVAPAVRRALAGVAWSGAVALAFIGVAIASYLAGHATGQATASWLAPVPMGAVAIAGSALVTWLVRVKLNRRPWQDLGLPRLQTGRLLLGAVGGAAALLAVAGVEYALGWLQLAPPSSAGGSRALLALSALVSSLGVGFSEELVFRGYVFRTLAECMPLAPAVFITGLIFGLVHFTVGGFSATFVFSVVLFSTMFLALRLVSGSLWLPIGFHALYDWTQTYLIGLSSSSPAHDPALIHLVRTGPALWVGVPPSIESGLLFMGMAAVVTGTAMALGGGRRIRAAAAAFRRRRVVQAI